MVLMEKVYSLTIPRRGGAADHGPRCTFSLNRVSIIHFKCCKIICQKQNCLCYLSSVNTIGSISANRCESLDN